MQACLNMSATRSSKPPGMHSAKTCNTVTSALALEDIVTSTHVPTIASVGLPFRLQILFRLSLRCVLRVLSTLERVTFEPARTPRCINKISESL